MPSNDKSRALYVLSDKTGYFVPFKTLFQFIENMTIFHFPLYPTPRLVRSGYPYLLSVLFYQPLFLPRIVYSPVFSNSMREKMQHEIIFVSAIYLSTGTDHRKTGGNRGTSEQEPAPLLFSCAEASKIRGCWVPTLCGMEPKYHLLIEPAPRPIALMEGYPPIGKKQLDQDKHKPDSNNRQAVQHR
jgi:hypothetical protein